MRKPFLAVFFLGLIIAANIMFVFPSETALAQDNVDPYAAGCGNDAYTYSNPAVVNNGSGSQIGYIELRFSNTCTTTWSKITSLIGQQELYVNLSRNYPSTNYAAEHLYNSSYAYTNQLDRYSPGSYTFGGEIHGYGSGRQTYVI